VTNEDGMKNPILSK